MYFTDEQMRILGESPYVLTVSQSTVNFTAEFKEKFWNLIQSGKEPHEAVSELGINPEILGKSRLYGIKNTIRSDVIAGRGFRDLRTRGISFKSSKNSDIKIKYLEQQLAYKDQEIEFLKKIVSLGKEAPES